MQEAHPSPPAERNAPPASASTTAADSSNGTADSSNGTADSVKERTKRPQPLHAALIPDALLTLSTASAICGVSQATLYRLSVRDPGFPKLLKLGTRCTRIRAGELTAWLATRGA